MTTVNKCPDCSAVMLRSNSCESCGWPKVRPKHADKPAFSSSPQMDVERAFRKKLTEVNAYVAKYQQQNPGASKRDACLAGLKAKGLTSVIPAHIRKSA